MVYMAGREAGMRNLHNHAEVVGIYDHTLHGGMVKASPFGGRD